MLVASTPGSERGACPVCHHPTGDCVSGHEADLIHILPLRDEPPGPDATVTVDREVTETRALRGTTRTTRVTIYKPGDRITPTEARRVGVLPPE